MNLTPTQTKIYKYLKKNNCDVTTAQIADHINYEGKYAKQIVQAHLNTLADKGLIEFEYQQKRVITLL